MPKEIFKVLKGKNMQPRILYPARISFKIEGEIKMFSNKKKAQRIQQYKTQAKRNTERASLNQKERKEVKKGRKKKKKTKKRRGRTRMEESTESSHANKPAYRFNHEHASNKIKLKRKK